MNRSSHSSLDVPLELDALLRSTDPELRLPRPENVDQAALTGLRAEVDRRCRDEPKVRPSPRHRVRAVATAVGSGGVAAAVITLVLARGTVARPGSPAGSGLSGPDGTTSTAPARRTGAPALLDRIATVASGQPILRAGPDEFVYVHSRVGFTSGALGGPHTSDPVHDREVWLPQRSDTEGWVREDGPHPFSVPMSGSGGAPPNTYAALAALPRDPRVLLARAREATSGQFDGDPDFLAFSWIGDKLTESIAPPDVSAALYRAAALIPGVELVPSVTDAAGRPGIGVAMEDPVHGERYEWIFDTGTFSYLGERDYLTRATSRGPAGMLIGTSAVLERGVTDRSRVKPAPDRTRH